MDVDVILTVFFGFLGYIMKKAGFNPIPLILGWCWGRWWRRIFTGP